MEYRPGSLRRYRPPDKHTQRPLTFDRDSQRILQRGCSDSADYLVSGRAQPLFLGVLLPDRRLFLSSGYPNEASYNPTERFGQNEPIPTKHSLQPPRRALLARVSV